MIYDESVDEEGLLKVSLFHGIVWDATTEDWRLHSAMTDVEFGELQGFPITGFRAAAITAIRPIPEPASLALVCGVALIGLTRRRRRR